MLTLQFVPHGEIEQLTSVGRIRKLLNIAKEDKIVILQGRLKKEEEKELIKATMEEINNEFKGIELAVVEQKDKEGGFKKFLSDWLLGDKQGLTIIGPASVVKEIKRDPSKIELLTQDVQKKVKKKKTTKKKKKK